MSRSVIALLALVAVCVLAGCGPGAPANAPALTATPKPLPSNTPVPTATSAPTNTPAPTATNVPTSTPIPPTSRATSVPTATSAPTAVPVATNLLLLAINPSDYDANSAERAVAEYLVAWQRQDWQRMADLTQLTWKSSQKNPAQMLADWFDFKRLQSARIVSVLPSGAQAVDIMVNIEYAMGDETKSKSITARVIRESAPLTPSSNGRWGVNPTSTLAER